MKWSVPKMWEGGECWIMGGGPSVFQQFDIPKDVVNDVLSRRSNASVYSDYMSAIHGKHIIGINAAFLLGDWIDMLFFGDRRFFNTNMRALSEFQGPVITCHHSFSYHKWVKFLAKDEGAPAGISKKPSRVSWNKNSGAAAISVAANAGAKRIVLLGFDMQLVDKESHWHPLYKGWRVGKKHKKNIPPFARHLTSFGMIARDAESRGISIINASPDSQITQFPKVEVKDLI